MGPGRHKKMPDTMPTLSISTEKVCFVVVKAREFDVKDAATVPDDGSEPLPTTGWSRSWRIAAILSSGNSPPLSAP